MSPDKAGTGRTNDEKDTVSTSSTTVSTMLTVSFTSIWKNSAT